MISLNYLSNKFDILSPNYFSMFWQIYCYNIVILYNLMVRGGFIDHLLIHLGQIKFQPQILKYE